MTGPITRRSLTEELVERLRDEIIEGTLRAGERVPEADICARYGVSRTPLRESLKVLAAEGLVTLALNRGATVARISASDIEELFPIIGALEALAGRQAAARAGDRDVDRIEALHRQMVVRYEAEDWVGYSKLNRRIHEAIFEIAGNQALAALYQQLLVRIHAVRFVARKSPQRWSEAIEDHVRMLDALRARDGEALARILEAHLEHKADSVQEALAALDGASPEAQRRRKAASA
jgi:DNA-binding GntR family transcriptional regulator